MKRLSKKDVIKKKEQDREAIVKLIAGLVLIMALITWGGGLFALGLPFIIGISIIPQGETLKDRWRKMGKKQKGVFVLLMVLLIPFLVVGLMWVAMIGSLLLIDILFFLPIFLIASWFIFKNPKNQRGVVTEFLGSYYSLALGVILFTVIIGIASWNYMQFIETQEQGQLDMGKQMTTIVEPDSSGQIHFDPIIAGYTSNGTPIIIRNATVNPNKTLNVTIKVSDLISQAWLGHFTGSSDLLNYLSYENKRYKTNLSNNNSVSRNIVNKTLYTQHIVENLTLNGYGTPIENAYVEIEGSALSGNVQGKPNGTKIAFSQWTDSNGIVRFKDVHEGLYILKVQALGYREYIREFPIVPQVISGKIYSVSLVPDYYKVKLHWGIRIDGEMTNRWLIIHNYKEAFSSNSTYVGLTDGSPMSDAQIINYTLNYEKDMWQINMQRIQSMYGWAGVNNPNNPLYVLTSQSMFTSQMLYTQSMYMSPSNPHNIYSDMPHLLFALSVAVITLVVVASLVFSTNQTIKLDSMDLIVNAEPKDKSVEGYNPQIYLFSTDSITHSGVGRNSIDIHYDFSKARGYGNPETDDNWMVIGNNEIKGQETIIVWGKDIPSDSTIVLHVQMKIYYELVKSNDLGKVSKRTYGVYSNGLEDTIEIHTIGQTIQPNH